MLVKTCRFASIASAILKVMLLVFSYLVLVTQISITQARGRLGDRIPAGSGLQAVRPAAAAFYWIASVTP
ncbi:MAG TPA: hypothetical protein VME43_01745, partial [Bryobacteraceae bacterium]|nr:hypothetical protein [Bryobacteraceae bacterium]